MRFAIAALARRSMATIAAGLVGAGLAAVSAQAQQSSNGVLVELFTSQGCYSCPPADELLGELAKRPEVVGLSLNVDYWDYIGWEDRLAQKAYTKRQYAYTNAHGDRAPGTPHVHVNGGPAKVGSRRGEIEEALSAAKAHSAKVVIGLERKGGTVAVAISGAEGATAGVVMAAPYHTVTQAIGAGENSGKTITYHNAAIEVRLLGAYEGGDAAMTATLPPEAEGLAVWLQQQRGEGPVGPVLGAAKLEF